MRKSTKRLVSQNGEIRENAARTPALKPHEKHIGDCQKIARNRYFTARSQIYYPLVFALRFFFTHATE